MTDTNIRPLESLTREELISLIRHEREVVGAGGVSLMGSGASAELERLKNACRVAVLALAHASQEHGAVYQKAYEEVDAVLQEIAP